MRWAKGAARWPYLCTGTRRRPESTLHRLHSSIRPSESTFHITNNPCSAASVAFPTSIASASSWLCILVFFTINGTGHHDLTLIHFTDVRVLHSAFPPSCSSFGGYFPTNKLMGSVSCQGSDLPLESRVSMGRLGVRRRQCIKILPSRPPLSP